MVQSSKDKEKDSGMVLILIFLILFMIFVEKIFIVVAIVVLFCDMLFPVVFKPFSLIWFGFGKILNSITSKVLLTIVYILVVTPVALFRKILKKDSLLLCKWKNGSESVLKKRNGEICPMDMKYQF